MDKHLRQEIESLCLEAMRCSADNHGFIQGLPMDSIAGVLRQYEKDCRKHARVPPWKRPRTKKA